jgi:hypothetical protein
MGCLDTEASGHPVHSDDPGENYEITKDLFETINIQIPFELSSYNAAYHSNLYHNFGSDRLY